MSKDFFDKGLEYPRDPENTLSLLTNGALSQKMRREDRAQWEARRRDLVRMGKLEPSRRDQISAIRNGLRKKIDDEEFRIRQEIPESEVRRFFQSNGADASTNLVKIKREDPTRWYKLKLAAWAYGLIPNRPSPPEAKRPTTAPIEDTFELSAENCAKWNLPIGTRVTQAEYSNMVSLGVQVAEEKRAAAENERLERAASATAEQTRKLDALSAKLAEIKARYEAEDAAAQTAKP